MMSDGLMTFRRQDTAPQKTSGDGGWQKQILVS
jgi:hypothetical protein